MSNRFYLKWIIANSLAEMIGLGTSALLWIAADRRMEAQIGTVGMVVAVIVGSTLFEGMAVGYGQWSVLRGPLPLVQCPGMDRSHHVGSFVAWTLGMAPSTLMNMGVETAADASPPEISEWMVFLLAALMGLGAGADSRRSPVVGAAPLGGQGHLVDPSQCPGLGRRYGRHLRRHELRAVRWTNVGHCDLGSGGSGRRRRHRRRDPRPVLVRLIEGTGDKVTW